MPTARSILSWITGMPNLARRSRYFGSISFDWLLVSTVSRLENRLSCTASPAAPFVCPMTRMFLPLLA